MYKEHKSIESYYKHVSIKVHQADHRGFLNSRKAWIRQHNEAGPDRKRLKSKKELQEARKHLDLVQQTGGRFIAPKKEFVCEDDWDPAVHGDFDPAKVVTENILGKQVKGIWRLKGRKGVFEFEEYQDTAVQERENVHDSREDGPFSEEALARKRKAVMDQVGEGSRARDKAAVDATGSDLSMQQLLEHIQGSHSKALEEKGSATRQGSKSSGSSSDSESGSHSSSAEEAGHDLSNLFGPVTRKPAAAEPKPKPKPQAKASTSQRPSDPPSKPSKTKKNKSASELEAPKPTSLSSKLRKEKESAEQPAAEGMLLADGRCARAFKNLKEKVAEWTGVVANIAIDDEPSAPDSQAQAAFKASCLKRSADLKNLGRQCRDYGKRMDKSSNKDAFEEPLAKLQELDAVCIAFSNMFSLTPQSSTSPEAYVKAFEECESKVTWFDQKTLGSAFQVKYCMAKASLACLYGDYEKFCQEFESKSPAMQDLAQKMGRNQLEALVVPEVEGRILLTLRGLKQEDVNALATGQVTSNMTEVINLCDAVVAHCKSPMGEFLAESLLDGCMLARNILSRDDVAATATAVQAGEQAKANSEADGTLVVGGAVEGFFLEHALGRSLFDLAVDHVKTGEKQGKVQESLQALATGLETLTMAGSSQGLQLIATLQSVQDSVDKCAKEVLTLKASKGDPAVANLKLATKAWEKCNNALGSYKKAFVQKIQELLEAEIKANLSEHLPLGYNLEAMSSCFDLNIRIAPYQVSQPMIYNLKADYCNSRSTCH